MRAVITEYQEITGKDGREWRVFNGISDKGRGVRIFLSANEAHKFELTESVVADKEIVNTIFANAAVVLDVEYDERGRVSDVTKEGDS